MQLGKVMGASRVKPVAAGVTKNPDPSSQHTDPLAGLECVGASPLTRG